MNSFLKRWLGKNASQADEKHKTQDELPAEEFNPGDARYDPQVRLKRGLQALFPHLPATPGLPPSRQKDER